MGNIDHGRTPPATPLRDIIADEIDRLIWLLDVLDGDTDLEPDAELEDGGDAEPDSDDEPTLGWAAAEAATGSYGWQYWYTIDCEHEHDGREREDAL